MGVFKKIEDWIDSYLLEGKVRELEINREKAQAKLETIKNGHSNGHTPVDLSLYSVVDDLSKQQTKRKGLV